MSYIGRTPTYGVLEHQLLTGTGSTTQFTLNYSVPKSAAVIVTVDGVYKIPTVDYGVQNTTLSFAVAPANLAKICIVFLGKELLIPVTPSRAIEVDSYTGDNVETVFSTTSLPVSASSIFVYLDGILKTITADYTIVGQDVTFTTAPASGAVIKLVNMGGEKFLDVTTVEDNTVNFNKLTSNWSGTVGAWEIVDVSFTAAKNHWYMIDSTGGAVSMTLPVSATLGDTIRFMDVAGSFNTNNLTIVQNGHKIMGINQDMTIDSQNAANALVYSNTTYGWRLLDL